MALNRSTGLRNKMLDDDSFKGIFTGGKINIYTGNRPASANDAVPGSAVLLAVVSKDGGVDGLSFDTAAANGAIKKAQGEDWREDSVLADGIAGWFRIYESTDTPANASTTAARADGTIGTSGADMNLSSVNLKQGAPLTLGDDSQFTLS